MSSEEMGDRLMGGAAEVNAELTETLDVQPNDLAGLLAKYTELCEEKVVAAAALKAIQDGLNEVEEPLLEKLAEAGIQSINCNGRTVYRSSTISVTMLPETDRATMAEILIRNGLPGCIQLGSQSISSVYRELNENGEQLPPEVAAIVNVRNEVVLRSRKS